MKAKELIKVLNNIEEDAEISLMLIDEKGFKIFPMIDYKIVGYDFPGFIKNYLTLFIEKIKV